MEHITNSFFYAVGQKFHVAAIPCDENARGLFHDRIERTLKISRILDYSHLSRAVLQLNSSGSALWEEIVRKRILGSKKAEDISWT